MTVERLVPSAILLVLIGISAHLFINKTRSVSVPLEWADNRAVSLFYEHDCLTCHTVSFLPEARGTLGPGLDGVVEVARGFDPVEDGKAYLRESLLEPSAVVRKGFVDAMPSYRGVLTEEEIELMVDWLHSLESAPRRDRFEDIEPVRVLPRGREKE